MPVMVALKETVSTLPGSELLRDVVAVDVDLLRHVADDAEADGLALLVVQRLLLAGLEQRRLGFGFGVGVGVGGRARPPPRRRSPRSSVGVAVDAALRRLVVIVATAAGEQDHGDDRDDRGDAEEGQALAAAHRPAP